MPPPTPDNREMAAALSDLTAWLIQQGLEDTPVETWLEACCNRLVAAGIPLQRVSVSMRAHHPEIGTMAFRWTRDGGKERENFQRTTEAPEEYLQSPIYYLLSNNSEEIRQKLTVPDPVLDFPIFDLFRERGATEYFATKK